MLKNSKLAALRNMLFQMERDVGLEVLSPPQRDVYYAACLVAEGDAPVNSDQVRHHPMIETMPRSTFFRILRELTEIGYLQSTGSERSGLYQVVR